MSGGEGTDVVCVRLYAWSQNKSDGSDTVSTDQCFFSCKCNVVCKVDKTDDNKVSNHRGKKKHNTTVANSLQPHERNLQSHIVTTISNDWL